ncbi:MAG: MFS transporter [Pseudomonadota bacterium]|nr:MFS transporter [Pseudomonadota bacterium]
MSIPFRLSFSYWTYFFYGGLSMPWWPIWLSSQGLSEVEIGDLLAFERIFIVVVSLIVAHYSDRTGHRRKILILFAVGMTGGYALFGAATVLWHFFAIAAFSAICRSPLIPLSDSITMTHVRREEAEYGKVRLWGTISFIIGSYAGGGILAYLSDDMILWGIVLSCVFVVVGFWVLPDTRSEGVAPHLTAGFRLATRPIFILFVITVALSMTSHTAVYVFGSLYWRGEGISEATISFFWAFGAASEIFVFWKGAALLKRFGPVMLIFSGAAAGVLRWYLTGISTEVWILTIAQALHAFTFGAAHLGGMTFINRVAPEELLTTAQTLYSALAMGAAMALMTPITGRLYQMLGPEDTFFAMMALAGSSAILALMLQWRWNGKQISV